MNRRREALGRNRRGPATKNMVPTFVAIAALIAGGGWFAYDYFTQPQRVFGARALNCPATEVSWTDQGGGTFEVIGCSRSVIATCLPEQPCVASERH